MAMKIVNSYLERNHSCFSWFRRPQNEHFSDTKCTMFSDTDVAYMTFGTFAKNLCAFVVATTEVQPHF